MAESRPDPVRWWLLVVGAALVAATAYACIFTIELRYGKAIRSTPSFVLRFALTTACGVLGLVLMILAVSQNRGLKRGVIVLGAAGAVLIARTLTFLVDNFPKSGGAQLEHSLMAMQVSSSIGWVLLPVAWGCSLARWANPSDELAAHVGGISGALMAGAKLAFIGFLLLRVKSWSGFDAFLFEISGILIIWMGIELIRNSRMNEQARNRARRTFRIGVAFVAMTFLLDLALLGIYPLRSWGIEYVSVQYYAFESIVDFANTTAVMLGLSEVLRFKFETSHPQHPHPQE